MMPWVQNTTDDWHEMTSYLEGRIDRGTFEAGRYTIATVMVRHDPDVYLNTTFRSDGAFTELLFPDGDGQVIVLGSTNHRPTVIDAVAEYCDAHPATEEVTPSEPDEEYPAPSVSAATQWFRTIMRQRAAGVLLSGGTSTGIGHMQRAVGAWYNPVERFALRHLLAGGLYYVDRWTTASLATSARPKIAILPPNWAWASRYGVFTRVYASSNGTCALTSDDQQAPLYCYDGNEWLWKDVAAAYVMLGVASIENALNFLVPQTVVLGDIANETLRTSVVRQWLGAMRDVNNDSVHQMTHLPLTDQPQNRERVRAMDDRVTYTTFDNPSPTWEQFDAAMNRVSVATPARSIFWGGGDDEG